MDFDASSAEPVGAVAEPEFDIATAKPVAEPKSSAQESSKEADGLSRFRIDPEKFQAMSTWERLKTIVSHPWDKYVASVDEGFKGPIEIPRVEADKGDGIIDRAGQVGAAVDNTVSGAAAGLASPGGIVSITNPATIVYSAPRFIAGGIENIIEAYKGAESGKDDLQTIAEKGIGGGAMVLGGGHGLKAGVKSAVRGLKSDAPPATPAEAINVLRQEAEQTVDPTAKSALEAAAVKVDERAKAGEPFDPSTAVPVEAQATPALGEQPVKVEARRPDGTTVEVEMPAAQAEAQIKQNMAALDGELNKVYEQAGIERNPPELKAPSPSDSFDPATAEPVVRPEPIAEVVPPEPAKPANDFEIHQDIAAKMKKLITEGNANSPEFMELWRQNEEVKNRHGGYVPEPPGETAITATKNAQVDAERASRGLPQAEAVVERPLEEVHRQAERLVQEDPQAGERLVNELRDSPRAVTDLENAVMLQRQVKLQNEFREVADRVEQDAGTPETIAADHVRVAELSDDLLDIYNVGKEVGTETGRGLNARKMAVADDFTLANLVTLRRAAKGGERLTPKELAETTALHDKIKKLQGEFDTYRRRASELLQTDKAPRTASRAANFLKTLETRADAARDRIKARIRSGQVSSGIDPELLKDYAEVGAYHIAKGAVDFAQWSVEMVKDVGEQVTPHLKAVYDASIGENNSVRVEKSAASKLSAYKTRTLNKAIELERRTEEGDFSKPKRIPLEFDAEARQVQARLESAKDEFTAALDRDRFNKLSAIGKLREQGINTYDAARNIMTTGELSFILRQGGFTFATNPIISLKAIPAALKALFSDEITARAIDLQTLNQPEVVNARAAKLYLAEEGAKLSRKEEIFASKWADKIPLVRNFNNAGRVFLNKVRFDVWKNLRDRLPEITPERDAQLAMFVNEATGRGTLGFAEPVAVPLSRILFSPRFLSSRIQLLVGHSLWGGDMATRRIISTQYAKALISLGIFYTLMSQMKDKKGQPATIEKDPRSSDFGKIKVGNTRVDPLAGIAQVIVFGARTSTLEVKTARGKMLSLQSGKFGARKLSDVATSFGRSKLHPIPGAIVNLFDGTDLGGNQANIGNQSANFVTPMTYVDIYQAMIEQDVPENVALSLLAILGQGLQTYDANKKRPKNPPTPPKK